MKQFSLVLLLGSFFSLSAQANAPLLKYSCMFQAGDTEIVVMDNGTVTHTEMPGHPPVVTMKEKRLTSAELAQLQSLIASAQVKESDYIKHKTVQLGLGQRVGSFKGYVKGQEVILVEVDRSGVSKGSSVVNPSPAVAKLQEWVKTRLQATNFFDGHY